MRMREQSVTRFRRIWVPTRGPYDLIEPREMEIVSQQVNKQAIADGWTFQWQLDDIVLEHFMSEAWQYWCTTSGTSTTSANQTWEQWCGMDSGATNNEATSNDSTTGSNSEYVWTRWIAQYPPPERIDVSDTPVRTEEQRAEFEANRNRIEAERVAKYTEAAKEKKEADRRAIELLRSQLNEEQLANYDLDGSFVVVAGRKRYRLKGAGVDELDKNDKRIATHCIHPSYKDNIPMADTVLAKKLLLDADPKEFLRIANRASVNF
jgi:hypothetical protein